jgi:hypothetical protein
MFHTALPFSYVQERLQRSCGGVQAHLQMGSAAFADSIPLRTPAIRLCSSKILSTVYSKTEASAISFSILWLFYCFFPQQHPSSFNITFTGSSLE